MAGRPTARPRGEDYVERWQVGRRRWSGQDAGGDQPTGPRKEDGSRKWPKVLRRRRTAARRQPRPPGRSSRPRMPALLDELTPYDALPCAQKGRLRPHERGRSGHESPAR